MRINFDVVILVSYARFADCVAEVIYGFLKFIRFWRVDRFTRLARCVEKTDKVFCLTTG
jgi:hypothetical protein